MSLGRSISEGLDRYNIDQSGSPGDRQYRGRSSGRRRVIIAASLLLIVSGVLFVAGPEIVPSPARPDAILPGLTIEDAGSPRRLLVTSVQSNSIADDAGIEVGDRIVGLDAQAISSRAEARRYLDQKHPIVVDMKLARADRPVEVIYAFPKRNIQ